MALVYIYVTTSSLTHILSVSVSLCSVYAPSLAASLFHTHTQMLCICHIKAKTSGQCSSSHCAPKQWNSLPSDICHIQSSHPHALKTVLKTNIYKQYHNKCFSILSPSFVTFLLCTNVYVPAWHRCGMQGIHMV